MCLRSSGNVSASKILKSVANDPEQAVEYTKIIESGATKKSKKMSNEEALATLVDGHLSKHQYNIIRERAPENFPSYKKVQEAKILCYPSNVTTSETSAKVDLQDLLDHTTTRLLETLSTVIAGLSDEELQSMRLFTKWGFDGSSGHSSFKQAFHGSDADDSAVFITCTVPIRLVCGNKIIWQNPRPGSTRYCRPLKIEFKKESTEVSLEEKSNVDRMINKLEKSACVMEDKLVEVEHVLIFAMVDGKVCNAITETTSTQRCFICGASSKEFNDVDAMISRSIKTENLGFGLSVLHGWIRMFECLLHISYKLPLKKWQARGEIEKDIVKTNKQRIQQEFRERCGLIVDKPKPGFGNSNYGNTARRFFQNSKLSAEITSLDVKLIEKLHTIMVVVSSGREVEVSKFRTYAYETARYFVQLYPWYNMPPTIHKFLIHGPEVISSALLPIGHLTEEAQEARNKDFKKYREMHARKCSREQTIRDMFLISSDPVISSLRKLPQNKRKSLPEEALRLIIQEPHQEDDSEISDGSDSSSEWLIKSIINKVKKP